jgi:hypothetical protein
LLPCRVVETAKTATRNSFINNPLMVYKIGN